ncbi:MAG TPA: hypothetical protein VLD38_03390 [Nitrosopumilaceae archaeon]|nr:hypothetical protein [Nitrosopumilaceae archaeon]
MTAQKRLELIKELQKKRGSKVITYVTGDRPFFESQIAGDTPRLFFDHLLSMGEKIPRLDLFLYSTGGDTSVPWRIISVIREFAEEVNVLIPYRAYSAATLISIGADHIFMGKKGELSPIDPAVISDFNPIDQLTGQRIRINVEDITSYITLLKEKVGLLHQPEIGNSFVELTKAVSPVALGYVNRHYSFIRMVAKKLLQSHREPLLETKIEDIIKELVERQYFHGHGIARSEAKNLGLKIETPIKDEEGLMWELYLEYEEHLQLNNIINPLEILEADNSNQIIMSNQTVASIESEKISHNYELDAVIIAKRTIPQQLQLNVNFQVPPGLDPNSISPQLLQQWNQQLELLAQQAMIQQSPITGFDIKQKNSSWKRKDW